MAADFIIKLEKQGKNVQNFQNIIVFSSPKFSRHFIQAAGYIEINELCLQDQVEGIINLEVLHQWDEAGLFTEHYPQVPVEFKLDSAGLLVLEK